MTRAAQAVRRVHRRLESVNDWDCSGFEAATPDGEDLVYCRGCGAICWRDGETVTPVTQGFDSLRRAA